MKAAMGRGRETWPKGLIYGNRGHEKNTWQKILIKKEEKAKRNKTVPACGKEKKKLSQSTRNTSWGGARGRTLIARIYASATRKQTDLKKGKAGRRIHRAKTSLKEGGGGGCVSGKRGVACVVGLDQLAIGERRKSESSKKNGGKKRVADRAR